MLLPIRKSKSYDDTIEYYIEVYEHQPMNHMTYDQATLLCFMLKINNTGSWRIPTPQEFNQIDWQTDLITDRYRVSAPGRAPFDTNDKDSLITRPLLPVRTVKDPAVHM